MKIAVLIARFLLGLLFAVFGLNGFLHFIPMPPPAGLAGQYMGALFLSHYLVVVFLLQLIGGLLLLANRFVPLALVHQSDGEQRLRVGAIGVDADGFAGVTLRFVELLLVGAPAGERSPRGMSKEPSACDPSARTRGSTSPSCARPASSHSRASLNQPRRYQKSQAFSVRSSTPAASPHSRIE